MMSDNSGTTIEIFTQIMTTDKNVFRSIGPYTPPPQQDQQRWPEEEGRYRSRSNDQRARGGRGKS
eukprot:8501107-Heterocapsa_arctica.AAC.1